MTPDGTSSLRSDLVHGRASTGIVKGATVPMIARHHDADLRPHSAEVPTAH